MIYFSWKFLDLMIPVCLSFLLKMSVILDQSWNSSKTIFVQKRTLTQQCLAHNVTCLQWALDVAKSWEVNNGPEQKVPLMPCKWQVMKSECNLWPGCLYENTPHQEIIVRQREEAPILPQRLLTFSGQRRLSAPLLPNPVWPLVQ